MRKKPSECIITPSVIFRWFSCLVFILIGVKLEDRMLITVMAIMGAVTTEMFWFLWRLTLNNPTEKQG